MRAVMAGGGVPAAHRSSGAVVLVCGLVAAIAAFYRLDAKGLWIDELVHALWAAEQGLVATVARFSAPPDLPLHFLAHRLAAVAGESDLAARMPSAVYAIGTVLLTTAIAARVFGRPEALLAGVLLSLAPLQIWYAQDARPYSALAFFGTAYLYLVLRWLERPSLVLWLGLTATAIAGIANHLFGVFPVALGSLAVALGALQRPRSGPHDAERSMARITVLGMAASLGATAVVVAPLVPGIVAYLLPGGAGDRPPAGPSALSVDTLAAMGAGEGPVFWLFLVCAVAGVTAGLRRSAGSALLLVAWIVLPIAVLIVAAPAHDYVPRYLLFIQAPWLILVAAGTLWPIRAVSRLVAGRAPTRTRVATAMVVLVALALAAVPLAPVLAVMPAPYHVAKGPDWSGICRVLRRDAAPDEIVLGNAYHVWVVDWCFRGDDGPAVAGHGDYDVDAVSASGRGVWYLESLAPRYPPRDPAVDARDFVEIPRSAWTEPGTWPLDTPTSFPFVITEDGARLFHLPPGPAPARVELHDFDGPSVVPGWPDYAAIEPARPYSVRVRLAADGPRRLVLTMLRGEQHAVGLSVGGVQLGRVARDASSPVWGEAEIALPDHLPDEIVIRMEAAGTEVGAISIVELRAGPPGS